MLPRRQYEIAPQHGSAAQQHPQLLERLGHRRWPSVLSGTVLHEALDPPQIFRDVARLPIETVDDALRLIRRFVIGLQMVEGFLDRPLDSVPNMKGRARRESPGLVRAGF